MVLTCLARHWLARRHYALSSWLACVARSLRVLLFYRDHARLLRLDMYRHYLVRAHDDVFHHLSHRDYLAKGLSLRERVRCVDTHYRFEEARFDAAYKHAVYRNGGLLLWRHETGGIHFAIRLALAPRLAPEGDLMLVFSAGATHLHRLSFSWVDGAFDGVDGIGNAIVPFIARNQGHRADAAEAFAAFERAFPNNSPGYFCFAALQGIAQALGMDRLLAVRSACQCAWKPEDDPHFANAYDGFWRTLGGVETLGPAWRIALPFYVKPLSEMAAKHRKRAAQRRAYWHAIGESSGLAVGRHVLPAHAGSAPSGRRLIFLPAG